MNTKCNLPLGINSLGAFFYTDFRTIELFQFAILKFMFKIVFINKCINRTDPQKIVHSTLMIAHYHSCLCTATRFLV